MSKAVARTLGYEDLNDHHSLCEDLSMRTGVERNVVLAGSTTLWRWGNRADREAAWRLHEVLAQQFITLFRRNSRSSMSLLKSYLGCS